MKALLAQAASSYQEKIMDSFIGPEGLFQPE